MEQYLVLDIGGTFIKYALMNREGQFLDRGKVLADTSCEEAMLASLGVLAAKFSETYYEGVAISMPGRIDTAKGWAYTGGAFTWLHDYPAAEKYGAIFGDKPCTVANDGKCAAIAESWSGSLADVNSGCVLVLGTGIGGGIVLNKQVWMGCSGGAGELSWLGQNNDALHDLATMASGRDSFLWTNRVSAKSIVGFYEEAKGAEKGTLDGIKLFAAYDAGEPEAKAVIDEFAVQMAAGILSLQCVLDVERYAIGGGISANPAATSVVRDKVNEVFDAIPTLPFSRPEIVTCRFGNEANLIGALAFHLRRGE